MPRGVGGAARPPRGRAENTKHKKTMETIKSGKLTDEVVEVLTKTAEELSSTY